MTPPRWYRLPAGLVLTTVLAGCSDITAPAQPKPEQLLDPEVAEMLTIAVDDVVERVLPDLSEYAQPTAIVAALVDVNAALKTRVPEDLTRGTEKFRVALSAYVTDDEAALADLDAVRLLFDDVKIVADRPPLRAVFTSAR